MMPIDLFTEPPQSGPFKEETPATNREQAPQVSGDDRTQPRMTSANFGKVGQMLRFLATLALLPSAVIGAFTAFILFATILTSCTS